MKESISDSHVWTEQEGKEKRGDSPSGGEEFSSAEQKRQLEKQTERPALLSDYNHIVPAAHAGISSRADSSGAAGWVERRENAAL